MNLVSCESCGVVLDKDRLSFAYDLYGDDGCIREDKALYLNGTYVAFVPCPVCEEAVPETTRN
jgi:hypothetical protein